jgi:transcriptional regulator with XRE-family HTH domain
MPQIVERELLRCAFRQCMISLRHKAGVAQERLALEAGIDRGYMGCLERGLHSPTIETLYKLFPPLGISFVQFAMEYEVCLKQCRHKKRKLASGSTDGRPKS